MYDLVGGPFHDFLRFLRAFRCSLRLTTFRVLLNYTMWVRCYRIDRPAFLFPFENCIILKGLNSDALFMTNPLHHLFNYLLLDWPFHVLPQGYDLMEPILMLKVYFPQFLSFLEPLITIFHPSLQITKKGRVGPTPQDSRGNCTDN